MMIAIFFWWIGLSIVVAVAAILAANFTADGRSSSARIGGSTRIWRRENLKDSAISWLLFASIVSVGIWGV